MAYILQLNANHIFKFALPTLSVKSHYIYQKIRDVQTTPKSLNKWGMLEK